MPKPKKCLKDTTTFKLKGFFKLKDIMKVKRQVEEDICHTHN